MTMRTAMCTTRLHFSFVPLAFWLLSSPTTASTPPELEQVLPYAAEHLASALADSLFSSGVATEEGIRDFAFPEVLGDVEGSLRNRLMGNLLGDLGLRRIAERDEVEKQLAEYFRRDGFELDLYDPASRKRLGGFFKDNQGFLTARVYTRPVTNGLWIYAQAELWNGQALVQVWNETADVLVASEEVLTHGEPAALEALLAQTALLGEHAERARRRLEWLQEGDRQLADRKAAELAIEMEHERTAADARFTTELRSLLQRLDDKEEVLLAREDRLQREKRAQERRLISTAGLLLLLGGAAWLLFLAGRSVARLLLRGPREIREATERRGVEARRRVEERDRSTALRVSGGRRTRNLADRLSAAMISASPEHLPRLRELCGRIAELGRAFESVTPGGFSGPVEEDGDPSASALRALAEHDGASVAIVDELERGVDILIRSLPVGPEVGIAAHLELARELVNRLERRLGERSDFALCG